MTSEGSRDIEDWIHMNKLHLKIY